ncbi:MAG: M50 family metallopeptidase [Clostridiales bacterium]|nr:M50 family metallopeptidase [Clostridiales bacterium]
MTIVYAIIILLILIFVHETGHLLSAKLMKVKVNEFALGMGPKLFGFVRGETQYSFRAIPVGGYCAMEGADEDSDDPRAFNNKSAKARAFILFAGSLMNILLAVVLLWLMIFSIGVPTRVVGEVEMAAPAYVDGLRDGDEIIAINGVEVNEWAEISPLLRAVAEAEGAGGAGSDGGASSGAGVPVTLRVLRDGTEVTISTRLFEDDRGAFRLGISPAYARTAEHFFKSFGYGVRATVSMGQMMYKVLGDLVTGQAGMDQLTGPVGIVVVVGDAARHGFIFIVQLTALISLNLGIVNLLPFPALDGGRLIFLLIRKVTGKKITNEIEGRVHLIGIIALFAFMAIITFQDIDRFFLGG